MQCRYCWNPEYVAPKDGEVSYFATRLPSSLIWPNCGTLAFCYLPSHHVNGDDETTFAMVGRPPHWDTPFKKNDTNPVPPEICGPATTFFTSVIFLLGQLGSAQRFAQRSFSTVCLGTSPAKGSRRMKSRSWGPKFGCFRPGPSPKLTDKTDRSKSRHQDQDHRWGMAQGILE